MKKLLCGFLAALFLLLSLCSCSTNSVVTDEMFALDTIITFSIYNTDSKLAKETIDKCKREITRLEKLFSATKEGSDVYNINHSNGKAVQVSDETISLLKTAIDVSGSCDGAFDVSVYPLVKLWGFDTKNYTVPDNEDINKALKKVGYSDIYINDGTVTVPKGMSIDLGAIAKGYIAESVSSIMSAQDIHSGIVNLGGLVISHSNDNKKVDDFTIGVEFPDSGEVFAQFDNRIEFVVTSGAYQRYFEKDSVRYHHIIDPKSGVPANSDISSVTVVGADGARCDALSTAFYVMGIDNTIEYIKTCAENGEGYYNIIILSKNKDRLYITRDIADSDFELYKEFKNNIEINVIDVAFE